MKFENISEHERPAVNRMLDDPRGLALFIHLARYEEGLCTPMEALESGSIAIKTFPDNVRLVALEELVKFIIATKPEREASRSGHHIYLRFVVIKTVENKYEGNFPAAYQKTVDLLQPYGFNLTKEEVVSIYRDHVGTGFRTIPKKPGRKVRVPSRKNHFHAQRHQEK